MNYEKMSRGMRYYYDKNIIHKTAGKRYVKYVCIKKLPELQFDVFLLMCQEVEMSKTFEKVKHLES